MTLSFSTKIKGKPTYFIEKIWKSILREGVACNLIDLNIKLRDTLHLIGNYVIATYKPKLHTIREDKANRWNAGSKIHFVINNRTKNRFQFAPVVKCVSVQKIEIKYFSNFGDWMGDTLTLIDGMAVKVDVIETLAKNDGFENVEDFFAYFNKNFTGKIIHWTDFKYEPWHQYY